MENKDIKSTEPIITERDVYQELRSQVGLSHPQCSEVMDFIDKLPIKIIGVENVKVNIINGIIIVQPNIIS